jgi:RNA polymerase sigma factor (TIGR02999 family)
MSDVTRILSRIDAGEQRAVDELLPIVYDELRRLAAQKMAHENPGQTLQATALVHEAYLRLLGSQNAERWDSTGHFFSAAAESMRRILIEQARKRARKKRGGELTKVDLDSADIVSQASPESLLEIDEALETLSKEDPEAAQLVQLRYFGGLTIEQAAQSMDISSRTAYRQWNYARAWLCKQLLQTGD